MPLVPPVTRITFRDMFAVTHCQLAIYISTASCLVPLLDIIEPHTWGFGIYI